MSLIPAQSVFCVICGNSLLYQTADVTGFLTDQFEVEFFGNSEISFGNSIVDRIAVFTFRIDEILIVSSGTSAVEKYEVFTVAVVIIELGFIAFGFGCCFFWTIGSVVSLFIIFGVGSCHS